MTLWVKHTKSERIALLQRAEEKFHINQLALEKDCWGAGGWGTETTVLL